MDRADKIIEWIDNQHIKVLEEHLGRTYYKIEPAFANIPPEGNFIEEEFSERCLHCQWQNIKQREGIKEDKNV